MSKIEVNKSAYTVYQTERGFTFIEAMIMLMVVSITMPFLLYFIQYIKVESYDDINVLQLYSFIRDHAIKSETVYVQDNTLYFQLPTGETASIEHYNDLVRRQVEGQGHEIYARNIKEFTLQPYDYGIKVIVTTNEGNTYEKVIAK